MNTHELLLYDKLTKKLQWFVCMRGKKYFDGDDYAWQMWPEYKEVTNKRLKAQIITRNKTNIQNASYDFVYIYPDGRIIPE